MMNWTEKVNSQKLKCLQSIPLFIFCSLLFGCPEKPSTEGPSSDSEPTLILSSAPVCTEQILPATDVQASDIEPTYMPLELRVTGISGSEASQLTTTLSFDPPVPRACFLSAVTDDETGNIASLRCTSPTSDELSFTGGRTFDAFYCTNTGRFSVKAKTTLNDEAGTVVTSNAIEVTCLPPDVFEENCERLGEEEVDMLVDMDLPDMDMVDMGEEIVRPASWSIVFDLEQEPVTDLSVQASTSPYPKNANYQFSVIDQSGAPLSDVPVKFFLDWSPLDDYPVCDSLCANETTQESCDARSNCAWNADEPAPEAGTEAEDAGSEMVPEPMPSQGLCAPNPMSVGLDERCERRTDSCMANLCLPPTLSGLPVVIEPMEVKTNANGVATVSVVTTTSPGIYSIKALAEYNNQEQEAHTASFTIWHQIPSQKHININCQAPVTAGFSRRVSPDPSLGSDSRGYINNQRIGADCRFQIADRFAGRVSESPVFFMSEAGNINQSVISDEDGIALAQWHTGGRSPVDVEPSIWSVPFVDRNANGRCDPEEAVIPVGQDLVGRYIGGCGGAIYEDNKELFYPELVGERPVLVNPRDGLVRIVGFTQGEARFIDLGEDLENDGDGLYSPDQDLVPAHSEPYVDANDNKIFDQGEEEYQDINRNGIWDADVFGREEEDIALLKCVERAIPYINQGINPNIPDCDIANENDLIDTIDELKRSNPDSLQATIWTSLNILSVGLPRLENTVSVTCLQEGDACRETLDATYPCAGAPQGLSVYLNLTRPPLSGLAVINFAPKDDNLNCLGVVGVDYTIKTQGLSSQDISASSFVPNGLFNARSFIIDQPYAPLLEECYDELRPLVPAAETYHWLVSGNYIFDNEDPSDENSSFSIANFVIEVGYPDHSISNDQQIKSSIVKQIGICR